MPALDPRSQALVDDFARQPGVTPAMAADLKASIESSRVLREELKATLESDPAAVRALRLTPPNSTAGGFYSSDTGTIHIWEGNFDPSVRNTKAEQLDVVTGVMGHELGHAQRRVTADNAGVTLDYEVAEALKNVDTPQLDLTAPFARYLVAMKAEEAQAEMLGINAVSSRVVNDLGQSANPNRVLERISGTTTCVEALPGRQFRWSDGLQASSEHQLTGRTPESLMDHVDGFRNLAAVTECYASHPHASLGAGGQSDYASYYGTYVIGVVQEAARDLRIDALPPIALDFKALGIDAKQLESNQPHLPYGPMVLVDTSDGQQRSIALRGGPSAVVQPDNPRATLSVRDPALLETLQGHCAALGREHGWTEQHVERASSALYAQCQAEYVTRIDGVVFGKKGTEAEAGDNLFAYGRQANGIDDRVYVGTREAMATPVEGSLQRAQAIEQQQAVEQQQYQQRQAQQQAGPAMSM
jgi:hypothetical protein